MWNEFKERRLSAALFLLYWLMAFGLDAFGWRKPANRPDMVQPVISLHLLLPVIAGALVSWWRRRRPGRIAGGMLAGAAVLVMDATAVVAHQLIAFEASGDSAESIFEVPVFLIALGLFGSLLGLAGAAGSAGIGRLLDRGHPPVVGAAPASRVIPRRFLRAAGGLALGVAAAVVLAVVPPVAAQASAGSVPGRAATGFTVNAMLNVLIGMGLLAPISWRSAGAGKVLVVMAGFVSLLLGSALLDGGAALTRHGAGMRGPAVACFGGAAGDLGAGVLALVAALAAKRMPEEK
jgi:hypothetical protein